MAIALILFPITYLFNIDRINILWIVFNLAFNGFCAYHLFNNNNRFNTLLDIRAILGVAGSVLYCCFNLLFHTSPDWILAGAAFLYSFYFVMQLGDFSAKIFKIANFVLLPIAFILQIIAFI